MPMPGRRPDTMRALEREVMLQLIDQKWREHLSEMDYLREGIDLRAMGQQDPAGRVAARRLRDVRPDDGRHRRRLRQDRHARPGPGPRAGRRPTRRPSWPARSTRPPTIPSRAAAASQRALAAGPAPGEEVVFAPAPTAQAAGPGRRDRRRRPGVATQEPMVTRLGLRPGRAQRSLPVRERQEVQVLPRALSADARCATSSRRPGRACDGGLTRPTHYLRPRGPAQAAGRAGGRAGPTGPLGRHRGAASASPASTARPRPTSTCSTALTARMSDAETLYELAVEEDDDSVAAELEAMVAGLGRRTRASSSCGRCSPGEHDDHDAVCEIHAKDGGTDAQDWAEMMLRMYQRWAERRGFEIEIEDVSAGQEAGILSATLHHPGPLRHRPADARSEACTAWCASRRSTPRPGARPASRR